MPVLLAKPAPRLIALAAVVFAVTFVALRLAVGLGTSSLPAPHQTDLVIPRPGHTSTAATIRSLQTQLRSAPNDPSLLAQLGEAELQRVRENGDATLYSRADGVLTRANELAPHASEPLIGLATLALARHQFRHGLAIAQAALRAAPLIVRPLGLIVDADVELGRYGGAETTLQTLVDSKPTLEAYARVSYLRELHGDLPGAISAMRRAISAGGDAPENAAYVQTLLGGLEFASGDLAAADRSARAALFSVHGYVPAEALLAQVEGARRDYRPAIARLQDGIDRLPLPQYVVALGETQLAAGQRAAAARTFALVGVEERLLQANGVNTDVDLALFEASHGSPARGVVLARRAWAEAPSVRSADALGWALTRAGRPREGLAWARRALRLGSRDAMFLFHAGMAARGAGHRAEGRRLLRLSLSLNPRFSPLYAPQARRALEALR